MPDWEDMLGMMWPDDRCMPETKREGGLRLEEQRTETMESSAGEKGGVVEGDHKVGSGVVDVGRGGRSRMYGVSG